VTRRWQPDDEHPLGDPPLSELPVLRPGDDPSYHPRFRPGISGHDAFAQIAAKFRPRPRNPSRTLSGADALAELRAKMHPENRGVGATAADRLNQGPQPPHETETSSATWYGSRSALADLGREPTLREISDSHAYVGGDGEGLHCHHFTSRDGVGSASMQACAGHVVTINEGRSRAPVEHQAATRAHLIRHLRDGRVTPPQPLVSPHLSGRAARFQFEQRMTYGPKARTIIQRKRGEV
jgi:hypothetical protein